jgi:pyruvate ferredoxin oxidoreductase beta subunit
MPAEEDLQVVVLTGDGAAYGMGLSATSAAIDRGLDFLYIVYDNEGYGNTGQQSSPATPHAARTATDRGALGFPGRKKDLFAIWCAHRPAYAATVIGAEPLDLARKVERAMSLRGPRLLLALAPCPTGWDYDPSRTAEIGGLAVKTGVWPLKEYRDGRVAHTKTPRRRVSVERWLETQGRFRHLFEPERRGELIDQLQRSVDGYWQAVADEAAGGPGD